MFGKVFQELEARRRPGKVAATPRECQTKFLFGKVFPELEARRRPGAGFSNTEGVPNKIFVWQGFSRARG